MRPILPFILILLYAVRPAQAQPARVLTVASYNVCNLFDTINDPGIRDLVLTPEAYEAKTVALARVIGGLSADIVALCEVENAGVLGDLLASAPLDTVPYRFIHYDSPDNRGIDVALLYRRDRVEPLASEPIRVSDGYPTRDILRAEFAVTGTDRRIAVYAVHLPSRRGGYGRAARMRETIAARLGDMAAQEAPGTGAIVLGDLNDHPGSKLVRRNLSGLRCLTAAPHRRGAGVVCVAGHVGDVRPYFRQPRPGTGRRCADFPARLDADGRRTVPRIPRPDDQRPPAGLCPALFPVTAAEGFPYLCPEGSARTENRRGTDREERADR